MSQLIIYRKTYRKTYRENNKYVVQMEEGINLENQKILKMGAYHYISIPKVYIDNKLLSISKKYKVILIEVSKNNNNAFPQNQEEKIKT